MRFERWWWILPFFLASVCIHAFVGWRSHDLYTPLTFAKPAEMEVVLEPAPEPKPEPKPVEKPKPQPKPEPKAPPKPGKSEKAVAKPARLAKAAPSPFPQVKAPAPKVKTTEPRPVAPKAEPGGVLKDRDEKPLPLGQPLAQKPEKPVRVARAEPLVPMPRQPEKTSDPVPAPEQPNTRTALQPSLRVNPRLPSSPSLDNNPLDVHPAEDRPTFGGLPKSTPNAGGVRLSRNERSLPNFAGGGSPAPAAVPGGHGGASGSESPTPQLHVSGIPGGTPGRSILGGGGGSPFRGIDNPLAADSTHEERPGVGSGKGGGAGTGSGGGFGFARGAGRGLDTTGKLAQAGSGGKGNGTRPGGGGNGTGSETPGTGGSGTGYGRGIGSGIGNGFHPGISAGAPGGGPGTGGGSSRLGLNRGIPFGDILGMLGGDPKGGGGHEGGPGGPGKGVVFGARPGGGGGGSAHIIYLLDTSGSMVERNKIGKAKEALKKALSELKPSDTFDIINFDDNIHVFAASMMSANAENRKDAFGFVDALQLHPGTNLSGALEKALAIDGITHIFILSDGEPSRGITNPIQLRALVKERNTRHVPILSLALTIGQRFEGMKLLQALAEENDGQFNYVDLSK